MEKSSPSCSLLSGEDSERVRLNNPSLGLLIILVYHEEIILTATIASLEQPLVGYPLSGEWSLHWHAPSYVACSSLVCMPCLHQLAPLRPHPKGYIIYFDHVHSQPIFASSQCNLSFHILAIFSHSFLSYI